MTNRLQLLSNLLPKSGSALLALALAALVASSACRSQPGGAGNEARGVIVVNAPAAGEVRRVLVREGAPVGAGAAVIEIAVRAEAQGAPTPRAEDPQARAVKGVTAAEAEIEAARAEVVRTEVEAQRLAPLVASGQATQGQLDGARADYERAQQRFQRAQTSAREAQSGLVAARQPSRNPAPVTPTPSEQIVTARATSAGTVSVVNVRVGERVAAGQPLATLRADER